MTFGGHFASSGAGLTVGFRHNETYREGLGRVSVENGRYASVFSLPFTVLKLPLVCFDWRAKILLLMFFRFLYHVCIEDAVTGCFGRGMIGV